MRHGGSDARPVINAGFEHGGEPEGALERDGHNREHEDAEKPRGQNGTNAIPARGPQLAGIADRGLESVGGPGREIKSAEKYAPTLPVPGARNGTALLDAA